MDDYSALLKAKRIAVVGLSDDPSRASYRVARYLVEIGREVVPVNPGIKEIWGLKAYGSLGEVPGRVDLVDVFRRPEYCAGVVEEAIKAGAGGVWLQSGIRSEEGRKLAGEAGMPFVQDRCLMVEISLAPTSR